MKVRGSGALSLLRSAWRGRGTEGAKPQAAAALSLAEREKLLQIVRLGCVRSTAAKFIGLTGEQLEMLLASDPELMREVLRAEAEAEVRHMGNVHKASNDEKNWRTSVWWLEQRGLGAPEASTVDAEYPEAVLAALEKFAELIVTEIPDVMRRQSLLTKLLHIALDTVEPPVVIDAEPVKLEGAKPQAESPDQAWSGLDSEEERHDVAAQ